MVQLLYHREMSIAVFYTFRQPVHDALSSGYPLMVNRRCLHGAEGSCAKPAYTLSKHASQ
jgi:hypothetical protein